MCYHKRLIFAQCNHSAWLPTATRPCALEQAFLRGESDTGCGAAWSHGYDTVRVAGLRCPGCAARRERDEVRLGVIKGRLRVLREMLGAVMEGAAAGRGTGGGGGGEGKSGEGDGAGETTAAATAELHERGGKGERVGEEEEGEEDKGVGSGSGFGSGTGPVSSEDGTGETTLEEGDERALEMMQERNEMFVSGRCLLSAVPVSLRDGWKHQWSETGKFGPSVNQARKLTREKRQFLLPILVAAQRPD